MIERKISQGAKPGKGGILPADKVTAEIAITRGIPMGQNCISPARHRAFSTPIELLQFIVDLRRLARGKPVGSKLCIGQPSAIKSMVKAMREPRIHPDCHVLHGAAGGRGPARPNGWIRV